jgi:hypothetical protein
MSDETPPPMSVPAPTKRPVSRRKVAAVLVLAIVSLVVFLTFGVKIRITPREQARATTAEEAAAPTEAALTFLATVDAGDYEKTWADVSPGLRNATNKTTWLLLLRTNRAALGTLQGRKRVGAGFADNLKDAPPGRYAVVAFESTFANTTIEEKIAMVFIDNAWKIAGYHMKKRIATIGSTVPRNPDVSGENLARLAPSPAGIRG